MSGTDMAEAPTQELSRVGVAPVRGKRSGSIFSLALVALLGLACWLDRGGPAAGLATLVVLCVVPGLGWRRFFPARLELGSLSALVVLTSLTWGVFVAVGCAYARFTHPVGLFVLLCLPVLAAGFDRRAVTRRIDGPGPATLSGAVGLLCVVVLGMVVAVAQARGTEIGNWGLLPALGPVFLVAIGAAAGLVLLGVAAKQTWIGLCGVVALGVEMAATPALLTDNLIGGWNYKHFGLVDLVASGQALSDPHDIYQQWPGFFAVAADFARVSGTDPVHTANWAALLSLLLGALGVFVGGRTLYPRSPAVGLVAAALFVVTGWAGQFYYSPESLGFVLDVLLLGVAAAWLPRLRRRPLFASHPGPWAIGGLSRVGPVAPVLLLAVFLAMVVSHQLTPNVLLLQLLPFVVFGTMSARWRWCYAVLGLASVGYLLLHLRAVPIDAVLTGLSLSNATPSAIADPSPYQARAATGAHVIALLVWGGAFICVSASRWLDTRVGKAAALALMPFAILLVGNYGGEAIYRVWLFSSPWCVIIIARTLVRLRRPLLDAACTLALVVLFAASAQATNFGMFPMLRVSDAEVSASRWLLDHGEPGAGIVNALPNFPARLNARYTLHNPSHTANDPAVSDDPQYQLSGLAAVAPDELADYLDAVYGERPYLVVSRSMYAQAVYYGTVRPDALTQLVDTLERSPRWHVEYRNADTTIFRPVRR